jgi:hypothetical protein
MTGDPTCNKKRISNIEQGMSNDERSEENNFIIRHSLFRSGRSTFLLFSNYRPRSPVCGLVSLRFSTDRMIQKVIPGNHRNPSTIPIAAPNFPNAQTPKNHGQRRRSQSGSASETPGSPLLGNSQIEPAKRPRWIIATTTGHAISQNLFENFLISSSHPVSVEAEA